MSHLAQLANLMNIGVARLAAANTAGDGSGTIATLWTCRGRVTKASDLATVSVITVANWSKMSNDSNGNIKNGDIVNLISGTSLTSIALNTDYVISNLAIDTTTDVATFELLNSSFVRVTGMSATNPVFQFPSGGRLELIKYVPAQASRAAVAAKVLDIYIKPRNGSYRHFGNIAITGHTPSNTVIATEFTYPVAYPFQEGDSIGVSQTVYGSAADQGDVIALGSQF